MGIFDESAPSTLTCTLYVRISKPAPYPSKLKKSAAHVGRVRCLEGLQGPEPSTAHCPLLLCREILPDEASSFLETHDEVHHGEADEFRRLPDGQLKA